MGAVSMRAADLLAEYLLAPGRLQRLKLGIEGLAMGRDTGVTVSCHASAYKFSIYFCEYIPQGVTY
jgi:hypothetical protein